MNQREFFLEFISCYEWTRDFLKSLDPTELQVLTRQYNVSYNVSSGHFKDFSDDEKATEDIEDMEAAIEDLDELEELQAVEVLEAIDAAGCVHDEQACIADLAYAIVTRSFGTEMKKNLETLSSTKKAPLANRCHDRACLGLTQETVNQ